MISRRRIVTRSRDELNVDFGIEDDEDVWMQKDKLYRDHIQEVLNKWDQIDDEIWAKIICMERNRRIAKAYARAPVLTVNGSDDGFDGFRIGLNGFANPLRDSKTEEVKKHIGHGVKIKMDDAGNILVKRISKTNVFVKEVSSSEDNSIASEIIKMNGQLELEKPVKLFDMKKFQHNVGRELRRAYPDRRKLESQCISAISFVKDAAETLDCCCWIMIINIVALEMLKSKLPPIAKRQSAPNLISIFERPRMPDPEEDPYSLPTSTNSSSSRIYNGFRDSKPPKLPPRDSERIPVPMPDYEDDKNENSKFPSVQSSRKKVRGYDDPYYCGMKARVPNFGKKDKEPMKRSSSYFNMLRNQDRYPYDNVHAEHDFPVEDEYGRIYGRFRTSPQQQMYHRREVFVGEWE
ncbi:uncharacterized protein LOC111633435 isoform X3 [Centruroides sculpturatus]|nr:uncharacterized protein LOC111633435 isoform X3 [Centruroides sculpturatus]XP_023233772.1 uncharacterized protein LOC111633435 isoform X3 [Centruroides sculpturatus]XP_023233773.1 uncharacterized protein LOC111633435 isoform X3 [Centruroides sculpturatus]